ncbi:MAG: hypothetical protein AB7E75_03590 [Candidatus Methanomethylophilaceae archaeon]
MSIIDLKFEDRFVGPILYGKKTTTLRRSRKADVGDRFSIAGQYYIINSVDKCEDLLSILSLWKEEGFRSAGDMLDWMEAHDYSPPLYLHRFERFFTNPHISFAGTSYLARSVPYDLIAGRLLSSGYEGLYRLANCNILECHEWMDPHWDDDEEEPFGAVYYDIFAGGADQECDPEPIDGGVLGYSESDTLRTLNDWLVGCGQGLIIKQVGVPADTYVKEVTEWEREAEDS